MAAIGVRSFWRWWASELTAMVPDRVKWSFAGIPEARKLRFEADAAGIASRRGGLVAPLALLEPGQDVLTKLKRKQVVDVIWPESACLTRNFSIPKVRSGQVRDVLALDLERATPFSEADVHWSHRARPVGDTKLDIAQFIVRRGDLEAFVERAATLGLVVRDVVIEGCEEGPILSRRAELARPARVWRWINLGLTLAALGLAGWSVHAPHLERQEAVAAASARVAQLTGRAVALRQQLDGAEASQAEKDAFIRMLVDRPLLVDTLRELTVRLPDTVWVADLQFRPESVSFSGTVRGSAAELVLKLAQSRRLADARLSGPVSKAQDGVSERFEIAVGLGGGQ